ncbi:MAG: DUF1569 domain-containing protein [Bacteroidetes bacterium]|nr:DUF1569 domain-containing protein [Bacteroidota bacterium]
MNNLKHDAEPAWGKMTPQHMVEHIVLTFQISYGKIKVECITPTEKFSLMKKILLSSRPLPKNFVNAVTGTELGKLENASFQDSLMSLKNHVESFENYYKQNPNAVEINPTFGPLNREEWIQFHTKHLTHHLLQFNLE